jgi:hypothetical protein
MSDAIPQINLEKIPCIICGDTDSWCGSITSRGWLCSECAGAVRRKRFQAEAEQESKWIDEVIEERKKEDKR